MSTPNIDQPHPKAPRQESHLVPLPDPLQFADGNRVTSAREWEDRRRTELLELFREHVYGRNPVDRPADLRFEPLEKESPALEGKAIRQRVRIAYSGPHGKNSFNLIVYYPIEGVIKGCFLLIANRSARLVTEAEDSPSEFWPVRDLIARGYATAAFHNQDVAADNHEDNFKSGAVGVFGPAGQERARDDWGAIGAWAWAGSRSIDFLETQPRLAGVPLAVIGHSRGGKTALWCGVQDQRVALAISNNSGTTGAALARTSKGETVKSINTAFPHWFALNYRNYNDNVAALPVDQHELIALMAPRLVYVSSASEDAHADPQAEFQACVEASPVYSLYGSNGLGGSTFPKVGVPVHGTSAGYHLRDGIHDLMREDWAHFMDFTDIRFKNVIRS